MNDIFHIRPKQFNEFDNIFYTIIDLKEETTPEGYSITSKEADSLAKKTINNRTNSTRFYIKTDSYGKPYNPIGMYSENQITKYSTKAGKHIYTFKEVNEKTFDLYLNFLKTKNQAWLRNTEREME